MPIVNPNEVKGFMAEQRTVPDRVFMVLDLTNDHEYVWEFEGYKQVDPDTNRTHWLIHFCCPKCGNVLTINSRKKNIEVTEEGVQTEVFSCTHPGEFADGGACAFKGAFELPPGRHRFTVDDQGRQVRVDAIFKHAA